MVPSDVSDVFAERLLQVIDEGRRTATYKLALLIALMDAKRGARRPCRQRPARNAHPHRG